MPGTVIHFPPRAGARPKGRALVFAPPRAEVYQASGDDAAAAEGIYRVADASLEGYLLYRGVDGPPDLAGAAWESFASLPHETAALAAGHVYQFVLRRRNAYGLVSLNTEATVISVDGGGALVATPPAAAANVAAAAAAGGKVLVSADYDYAADGDDRADTFLVYGRADGTDPDPATDTPVEVAMVLADGIAKLSYLAGPYSEGTTLKATLRTRRSGTPDVDSASSAVASATATLLGPDAPEGAAFVGSAGSQL